jgi:hypothetical protein
LAPDPYIRFRDPDDMGLRPPDASLYTTPAISITKPSGLPSTDPAVVYADVDNQFVRVEVGNKGNEDADAFVTVWAYGFGTNSGPSGYSATLGGTLGTTAPIAIPAGASGSGTAVTIPWKPQAGELGGGTQLHCCVRANVFINESDRQPPSSAPQNTPPSLDIHTIYRHAQRNITLLPKPPGVTLTFALAIGNPDIEDADEFTFEISEVRGKFNSNEIWHLRQTEWVDNEFSKGLLLPGTGGELELKPAPKRAREFGLQLGKKAGKKVKSRLKPGEQGKMELELDLGRGGIAGVHRFDIVQRGRKGDEVGAARVMTVTVPEDVFERAQEKAGY